MYASGADGLFVTLKEMGIAPGREVPLREAGVEYVVDLTILCRLGMVSKYQKRLRDPKGSGNL